MKVTRIIGTFVLVFISGVVFAQSVPQLINYQGRLTDDTGLPIDGTREMRFRLLDADTISASVLWSETQSSVQVDQGIYHVLLGSVNPVPPSALSQADIYLEVIVAGEILRPRSQISSVPFAHKAASVPDSSITSAMIADGTITGSDIDSQTITSTNIADETITSTQIQDDSLGTADIQDIYVLNTGDTVTGDLQVDGFIGIGRTPHSSYGIRNDSASAPDYGAQLYGATRGIHAAWSGDPNDHFAYLGTEMDGVFGRAGAADETADRYGARFSALSQGWTTGAYGLAFGYGGQSAIGIRGQASNTSSGAAYAGYFSAISGGTGTHYGVYSTSNSDNSLSSMGVFGRGKNTSSGSAYGGYFTTDINGIGNHYGVYGYSYGNSASTSYGVRGQGRNDSTGVAYGGYFNASTDGTGTHYGIYASGDDYAGWFEDGSVHVGDAGVEDYATSDGDLYVEDALEVDGIAYFSGGLEAPGAIDSSDISDGTITGSDIASQTITSTNIADGTITSTQIQDLSIAGSDLQNDSLGFDQIQDIYVLNTGDTVTGTLLMYGPTYGAYAAWSSDPADHYAYLGSEDYGVYAKAGAADEAADRYGGWFESRSQGLAVGAYGQAYGYGAQETYGVRGISTNYSSGPAYGGYFTSSSAGTGAHYGVYGYSMSTTSAIAAGISGRAQNLSSGNAYGGTFIVNQDGTGNHYGISSSAYSNSASSSYGVSGYGNNANTGTAFGGYFSTGNGGTGPHYGMYGYGNANSDSPSYGVRGQGRNDSTGDAYGGYFATTLTTGTGTQYGVYAAANDYSGWFEDGRVHVGDGGTEDYTTSDGDLYVEDALEVDGVAYFSGGLEAPGAIDSSDVSFNYAGSSSQGGAASDLDCTDCVADTEVAFNYAGSASEGGPASDLSCADCLNETEIADIYVLNSGDTVTGDLQVNGNEYVGLDLTVTGGNIGIGTSPNALYGILNDSGSAPSYGAYIYGSNQGVRAMLSSDPSEHFAYLGSQGYGVYARSGNSDEAGTNYGGNFEAYSQGWSYGVSGAAYGYGISNTIGVRGSATNYSDGPAYGGYFVALRDGTGTNYGIFAGADDYAGWFEDGRVHVGDGGTEDYVDGDGDLFVENELEVGSTVYFSGDLVAPGAIDSSDIASGAVMAFNIGENCAIGEALIRTASGWACSSPWSQNMWTWMSGSDVVYQYGVYGTKGTPNPANVPGSRDHAVSWTDSSGDLWLFGGWGYPESALEGHLNDLWRWDGAEWSWMSGDTVTNQNGVYGIKGTPDPANVPGSRQYAVSWTDSSGDLWLFGGNGYPESGIFGRLNGLWRWDGINWTWMSGDTVTAQNGVYGTKGTPDPANVPGSRENAVSWTDSSNNLWLFGGYGNAASGSTGYLNDLWRWDGAEWTWMSGDTVTNQNGEYGTKGTPDPANVPGSRENAVSWIDSSNNLWLFGGNGYPESGSLGRLNDLWRWDGTNWTWMSGSNLINQSSVYGTKGIPDPTNFPGAREDAVSWIDSAGYMWLFGGRVTNFYNDLWRWDGTNWTWMSGTDLVNQNGVYGTTGIPTIYSFPGSRFSSVSWTDSSGNLWLFGGWGYPASGGTGYLNDLWRYKP